MKPSSRLGGSLALPKIIFFCVFFVILAVKNSSIHWKNIIAIFSGVQLFSLGIIGEYIGRIHQSALDQPCYVVAESTADQGDSAA